MASRIVPIRARRATEATMAALLNFVGFQIVWVLAVAGASKGLWWPGLAGLVVYAAIQLWFSKWPLADLMLMLSATVIGCLADTLLIQLGLLSYAAPYPSAAFAPAWIAGLWLAFSLTINHSMSWLKGRWLAALLFGLIGGPLVFWFAERYWFAVRIAEPKWQGLLALGIEWALMTPLLLLLAGFCMRRFGPDRS